MKNETLFRGSLAFTLLILVIMTFEYFEKDRVYQELKISSSKQIDSLKFQYDSLYDEHFETSHELGIYELIIDELSQTKKYRDLLKDIEKEKNSNKYE